LLEDELSITDYKVIHGEEIHIFERLDDVRGISRAVSRSGLTITKLTEEGQDLEEYYLEKVGGRK
ncbi:MAG: ABC transporter ATP-binding protein, partial [Oscillospiraceae bacterium]|nr:ABC transporter ATP-binding protein [Oscillospiraceae bacterium]